MDDRHGTGRVRCRLLCRGVVQGVGFRPAVYRLAVALGLGGHVRNDADGATIEVEGAPARVAEFRARLPASLPALARLDGIVAITRPATGSVVFEVVHSAAGPRGTALIPADAALCPACRRDMDEPGNRRHHYPFTTCTDCGPRFTLARALPYDRERTAMAPFAMCPECAAEYGDPGSRRFHAEPVCCPACGPTLRLVDGAGRELARAAGAARGAREALAVAAIVAVHGLGGFQLACLARDEDCVQRLRERKRRPTKPFAVMVPDLERARRLVALGADDLELLSGARAPILLAPARADAGLAPSIAAGIEDLGVMLPTTPLHVELFRDAAFDALVMTSGNRGDEPICRTPEQAAASLVGIADLFLVHDREVVRRVDDSVVRSAPRGPILVRRSRGFVPDPVALPVAAVEPVLALGGHLQTTVCVAVGGQAFPSQHVGDLDTEPARAFLREVGETLEGFLEVCSKVVAVDQHPDYPSTWLGERLAAARGGRVLRLQHHLAHAAAVLGEHSRFPAAGERAGALVLDGTGYGPDGTAWGCECLCLDGDLGWGRTAHAQPLALVGGERAVREPWRVALAGLQAAGCAELHERLPLAALVDGERRRQVLALAAGGEWPRAYGAGRIFEAAGALAGVCVENGWEGEAAVRLETLAARAPADAVPWPEVAPPAEPGALLPTVALLSAFARRLAAGEDIAVAARGFHRTFARLGARMARASLPADVDVVAVGGGCLVNRLLRDALRAEFAAMGMEPLLPRALPPGDGGLSYGQAVLAAASLARGHPPHQRESSPCA